MYSVQYYFKAVSDIMVEGSLWRVYSNNSYFNNIIVKNVNDVTICNVLTILPFLMDKSVLLLACFIVEFIGRSTTV